ncbi:hypothetical protein FOZ62_009087, partial [Perkinsus olseni]
MSIPSRVCVDEVVLSTPKKNLLILGYLTELVVGHQPRIPDELRRYVGGYLHLSSLLPTVRTLVKGCPVEAHWGLVKVAGGFAIVNYSPFGFNLSRFDLSGTLLYRKAFPFQLGRLPIVVEPRFISGTSGSSIYAISFSIFGGQLCVSILPLEGEREYYDISWPDIGTSRPLLGGMKEIGSRLFILANQSEEFRLLWLDVDRLSNEKLNAFSGCLSLGHRSRFTFDPKMDSGDERDRISLLEWPSEEEAHVYRRSVDVVTGRIEGGSLMRFQRDLCLECWLGDGLACVRPWKNWCSEANLVRVSSEDVESLFSIELLNVPRGFIPMSDRRLLMTSYAEAGGGGGGLGRWHA